jgi:hypothetical protein
MQLTKTFNNNALAQELLRIQKERGGLNPRTVVDAATPENSPLHNYFTWDNEVAGEKCRLQEARQLIATVKVQYEEHEEVRFFVSISKQRQEENPVYVTIDELRSDVDLERQYQQDLLNDINRAQAKYRQYRALGASPELKAVGRMFKHADAAASELKKAISEPKKAKMPNMSLAVQPEGAGSPELPAL